jgi:hypothetical protein
MTRTSRSSRARKRIGVTLIVVGGAAMVLYLAAVVFNRSIASWLLVTIYVLSVSLQFLTGLGAFLLWRERQYAAKADAERIITDSKPHVLYLRAFRSDPKVFSSMLGWQSGLETQEEQLAEVLRPIGELVAIGRPGERLPEPGAARIYASDEEWKEVVKRQMQAARLVIIRAEVGENLLWELKHAVETLNPQKVLILILEMKAKHYESFRTEVNPILGLSLPEGATLWRRYRHVSGFIGFGAGRTPSVFPLGVPYFRTDYYKPYRQLFKFALRPVFESFGLEWQPPPDVFWFNVIGVLLGWLLGILWILNGILFFINRTNMLLASLFVIVLVLYVILRLARRILLG